MGECKRCGSPIEAGDICENCKEEQDYIQRKNEESMFDYEPEQPTYETPKRKREMEEPEPVEEASVTQPERVEQTEPEDPFLFGEKTESKSKEFKRPKVRWVVSGLLLIVLGAAFLIYIQITSKDTLYFTMDEEGQLQFMNRAGKIVLETDREIQPTFPYEEDAKDLGPEHIGKGMQFTGELYPARVPSMEEGPTFGYINKEGEWGIEPSFQQALPFYEGRALVIKDGLRGFINVEGEMVIPADYHNAKDFKEGYAPVMVEGYWGYVNKDGDKVIEPSYEEAYHFNDGVALVKKDRSAYFIDTEGKKIMEKTFPDARAFSEGLAPVRFEEGWSFGYVDEDGNTKIKPQFVNAYPFHDGYATVCPEENKCGVINKGGHMVVEPEFESIGWFVDGLAFAFTNDRERMVYINTKGETQFEVDAMGQGFPYYNGLVLTIKANENPEDQNRFFFQYRNKNGEVVHEFDGL